MKALRTDTMFVSILAASIYIIKVGMGLGLNFKLTKLEAFYGKGCIFFLFSLIVHNLHNECNLWLMFLNATIMQLHYSCV